ncbi:hypothetical protein ACFV6F_01670 [Kitasatospora phosalacinea]|uniref:hypothetical protein n=1 Tax=Kitasatospora phosalacinea TaxID=2065 RepID=UPI00364E2A34
MSRSRTVLLVGLVLGLTAAPGGFGALLLVGASGALGWPVGSRADGTLDLADLSHRDGRR